MSTDQLGTGSAGLDRVKEEAAFFMEKTFQVSFGYLGALVALVGAAGLDVVSAAADRLHLSVTALFCCGVLIVNLVYLALAAGLLFATVKRGLFLVMASDSHDGHHAWEFFLRRGSDDLFLTGQFGHTTWNIDNFYMAPLFALIFAVSLLAAGIGLESADSLHGVLAIGIPSALHLLPLLMLLATAKMTKALETQLAERE